MLSLVNWTQTYKEWRLAEDCTIIGFHAYIMLQEFYIFIIELALLCNKGTAVSMSASRPLHCDGKDNNSKSGSNRMAYEVFLGGSCNPTTWRSEIAIPTLQSLGITYYNPQVSQWGPELIAQEYEAKQTAKVLLFVIDNQTRNSAGIIEAAQLAATRRESLIVVIYPYRQGQTILGETVSIHEYYDLMNGLLVLQYLMERQRIPIFESVSVALNCTSKVLREEINVQDLHTDDGIRSIKISFGQNGMDTVTLREIFKSMDTNDSGSINLEEAWIALQSSVKCNVSVSDLLNVVNKSETYRTLIEDGYRTKRDPTQLRINFEQFCALAAESSWRTKSNGVSCESEIPSVWSILCRKASKFLRRAIVQPFNRFLDWTNSLVAESEKRDLYVGVIGKDQFWLETNAAPSIESMGLTLYRSSSANEYNVKVLPQELQKMKNSRLILLIVPQHSRGITIMALAAHLIGLRAKLVLCVQTLPDGCIVSGEKLTEQARKDYNRGRMYLSDYATREGVPVFQNIAEALQHAIQLVQRIRWRRARWTGQQEKDKVEEEQKEEAKIETKKERERAKERGDRLITRGPTPCVPFRETNEWCRRVRASVKSGPRFGKGLPIRRGEMSSRQPDDPYPEIIEPPGRRRADSFGKLLVRFVSIYWKSLMIVLWPLILLPLVIVEATEAIAMRCLYVVGIMAIFWMTEVLPLPVTGLIPIVLYPLMGIMSTGDTCACYMNDTTMMFIGSMVIAIVIENSGLHMRVALLIIKTIGCSHRRLTLGLFFVTMFLSMWISNTAATAMMLPIVETVLLELEAQGLGDMFVSEENVEDNTEPVKKPTNVTMVYYLVAAYASSLGGIGTLVGSGTNLTLKGFFEKRFPDSAGISLTSWMLYSVPPMLLMSFLTWLWLQVMYMGLFRPKSKDALAIDIGSQGERVAAAVIDKKYKELGSVTWHETTVGVLFVTVVLLWFFRSPGFVRGWPTYITNLQVKDSTAAVCVSILFFILPSKLDFLRSFDSDPANRPTKCSPAMITWKMIHQKMHWSLILVLGGGFAISAGSTTSRLSSIIGNALIGLQSINPLAILFIVCAFAETATELTSNVAVANIILPVLAEMCVALRLHPLYLMLPATLCCSFSFHLPVGTPPNAIVTAAGHIKTRDFAIAGIGPSVITLIVTALAFSTWGTFIFNLSEFPGWAT
ncbi:uncharacterized protein LOC117608989 [Osmia lignaria lignaria]|uniref:uncharacterized protein LOC117608989 n=1 Tax=Osmia lignaria lignaria TaxID=1437193 RepID=UPI00402BEC2E